MRKESKISVIYLVSTSFSGSTLLSFLIGAHANVENLGELQYYNSKWRNQKNCTCGSVKEKCPFWTKFWSRDLQIYGRPSFVQALKIFLRAIFGIKSDRSYRDGTDDYKLFAAIAETLHFNPEEKCYLLDNSKNLWRLNYLMECKGIELHVIHLRREAKSTIASYIGHGNGLLKSILVYKLKGFLSQRFLRVNRKLPLLRMDYEQMCANPDEMFQKVGAFIGLDLRNNLRLAKSRTYHVASGNSGPIRQVLKGDLKIQANTSKFEKLTKWQRMVINSLFR